MKITKVNKLINVVVTTELMKCQVYFTRVKQSSQYLQFLVDVLIIIRVHFRSMYSIVLKRSYVHDKPDESWQQPK